MAKPKSPLLSFGARGTIANSLTFQKRRQLTIAREKPIPTDPKSPAQLTQRQKYKDAVSAWHALTPEEKEAWRGVCPGLTAYQCFMSSELKYAPPPPEEYTEEQTQHDSDYLLNAGGFSRVHQRLTIPNRKVTKLAVYLRKEGNPTDPLTFTIRRISDDSLIASKVWGNAADLPTETTLEEVEFDDPPIINEEARIGAEYDYGDGSNGVRIRFQNEDVKENEFLNFYMLGVWYASETRDLAYRYKYYLS